MKINLKKIFGISSSKSAVIDNVKIIRSTKRFRTISLQIKNGIPIIYCPTYIKDSYLKLIIKKKIMDWKENQCRKRERGNTSKKQEYFPFSRKKLYSFNIGI